jgi:hypothetical protein
MDLFEVTNVMTTALKEAGNPPVAKSFDGTPIALSATITVGGVEVR